MLIPLVWLLLSTVYAIMVVIARNRTDRRLCGFWFVFCLLMFFVYDYKVFHEETEGRPIEWTRFR